MQSPDRSRSAPLPAAAGDYLEDPTDEDYAAAARWALGEKNFPLAVQQASTAVALRPLHEPHIALLDDILRRAKGPLELVKLPPQGGFFGLCAARARVLSRLGRIDEALEHLFEATATSPSTPFLPWARAWVKPPKNARKVRPDVAAAGIISMIGAVRERGVLDDGAISNLHAALDVAKALRAQHEGSPSLVVACSRVLRVLGRLDEALALLESPAAWATGIERAAVLRELGDHEARACALSKASALRPEEPSTYVDLGDAHLDDGRPEDAANAYECALAMDSSSTWARVSAAYARAIAVGSVQTSTEPFEESSRATSPDVVARGRVLWADLTAYTTRLADPIDPVAGVIRSAAARAGVMPGEPQIMSRVRAHRPLSPSARLAYSLALSRSGRRGRLVVESDVPDARWGPLFHSGDAAPAVVCPPDEVRRAVADLAGTPFAWDDWRSKAGRGARRCQEYGVERILHAMAYPLDVPADFDPVQWVHGYQVAAALLVAAFPAPVEIRLHWLTTLIVGSDDWTAAAALLGLRALGPSHPPLLEMLLSLVPTAKEVLPSYARALAIVGSELSCGASRRLFFRLRARVIAELAA